jgi:hypothetical protein
LADVRGDEGVALGHFPDFLDHRLRLDEQLGVLVFQAFTAAPFVDLLPPGAKGHRVRPGIGGVELREQFDQHVLDVAHDRDVDLDPLGD